MAFITNEDVTVASQAVCKLAQGLIRDNHDGPHTAKLEVCHLDVPKWIDSLIDVIDAACIVTLVDYNLAHVLDVCV